LLHEIFPKGRFSPPATAAQIASVEAALGSRLPEQLRLLYLECDGFREDRGNAKYLLSLTDEDHIGSLLSTTKFWREEWKRCCPKLDFRAYVFYGFSSADECWGISTEGQEQIIAYQHGMGDAFENLGTSILDIYRADYARYDDL
jgi:hypothetical protein